MVVIGHSQGGLLTRLVVTESGDRFWNTVSDRPFDEFDFTDSERKFVGPVFFFDPSPYVTREIFVATPHAGSYVAGNWIGKIGASLVSAPKAVVKGAGRLARRAVGDSVELGVEEAVIQRDLGQLLLALEAQQEAAAQKRQDAPAARQEDRVRVFDVEIRALTTGVLRPGMTANVKITGPSRQGVIRVPVEAVFLSEGLPIVYRVRGDTTDRVAVELGLSDLSFVEILEGLALGDSVALEDPVAARERAASISRR